MKKKMITRQGERKKTADGDGLYEKAGLALLSGRLLYPVGELVEMSSDLIRPMSI